MAGMRENKKKLRQMLESPHWRSNLEDIAGMGMAAVGPLFSFLPHAPEMRHRAALALGRTVAKIAEKDPEKAKNVARRYMWHMSEESGNIGWGIPEAFAETLAASPALARTYASILISYIIDLGHDDNFCDNDVLRRSCYWAIGRFAQADRILAEKARPWLIKGLADRDSPCRGMAAWALGELKPDLADTPPLRRLAESGDRDECEFFEGDKMRTSTVSGLAREALAKNAGTARTAPDL